MIERNFSFEMVVEKLEKEEILGIEPYPNQMIFVLRLRGYICYVPFVETKEEIFLKTIIPSRKLNKIYKES